MRYLDRGLRAENAPPPRADPAPADPAPAREPAASAASSSSSSVRDLLLDDLILSGYYPMYPRSLLGYPSLLGYADPLYPLGGGAMPGVDAGYGGFGYPYGGLSYAYPYGLGAATEAGDPNIKYRG